MADKVYIEGFLYHKIYDSSELKALLSHGKTIDSNGVQHNVTESVLHWAGSSYTGFSSHYQINICWDKLKSKAFALVADKSHFLQSYNHSHTWKRNSGKIGVSYICMFDVKLYPVTEDMMKLGGAICSELASFYNYPIHKISDHEDYAILDNYKGLRWDCELPVGNGETVSSRTVRYALTHHNLKLAPVSQVKPVIKVKSIPIPQEKKTKTIFEDVYKEDWYSIAIENLSSWGVLIGSKEGNLKLFNPDADITRGQAAQAIYNTLNFLADKLGYPKFTLGITSNKLTDIQGSIFSQAVSSLVSEGVLSGYPDNTFRPDNTLTRGELAHVYSAVIDFINKRSKKPLPMNILEQPFKDVHVHSFSYAAINKAYSASLLVGYKEQTGHYFRPDKKLTRAEFSVSLYKLVNTFNKLNK